jgi:hypothetical protein
VDGGTTWTVSTGLPANDAVIADRVNPMLFYSFDAASGSVYASLDGGASFSAVSTGLPKGQLRTTSYAAGDLWLATGSGLYHSANLGVLFTKVNKVVSADAVGFGMPASGRTYPTIFISGNVNSVVGIFRSIDGGKSWLRINDNHHQWGFIGTVIGDPRIFGRVYLGTNGRGIIYGDSN